MSVGQVKFRQVRPLATPPPPKSPSIAPLSQVAHSKSSEDVYINLHFLIYACRSNLESLCRIKQSNLFQSIPVTLMLRLTPHVSFHVF